MNIYVASSWRNPWQPGVVKLLRNAGHEVYDFREPVPGERGFAWSDIDPDWQEWRPEVYRKALKHKVAEHGFSRDMTALRCGKELDVPGALAFGVPDTDGSVNKHHICVFCWDELLCWLYNDGEVVPHPRVSGETAQ